MWARHLLKSPAASPSGRGCAWISQHGGWCRVSWRLPPSPYLLTLAPSEHAGRAYAAYGGIYISTSLLWLWVAEGQQPDRWDLTGGGLALIAAAIILFAPRSLAP